MVLFLSKIRILRLIYQFYQQSDINLKFNQKLTYCFQKTIQQQLHVFNDMSPS
jgi:hypothetical protein